MGPKILKFAQNEYSLECHRIDGFSICVLEKASEQTKVEMHVAY
jgi:hypothetical protein